MIRLKLETVPCPNCLSLEWKTVARPVSHHHRISGRFSVVRCNGCRLAYLNPCPDKDTLENCYKILEDLEDDATLNAINTTNDKATTLRRLWHKLNYSNPVLEFIDRGPVLDVGCNRGDLLTEVAALGYEAYGLDHNPKAVADCQRRGLSVILGDIESVDISSQFYKCIVLSHTLEHLRNPVAVLRKLRDAIPPDGKIVVCVPNARSPMAKLFGDSWHGWDPPFHLIHFDKVTLKHMSERANLVVTRVQVRGHPEDFTRSLAIWSGKIRRHLWLRTAMWPLFAAAGAMGHGSYLLAALGLQKEPLR